MIDVSAQPHNLMAVRYSRKELARMRRWAVRTAGLGSIAELLAAARLVKDSTEMVK